MRILNIIESLGVGGAEKSVVRLSQWWASQGHEVHVAVSTPNLALKPDDALFQTHVLTPSFNLAKGIVAVRALASALQPEVIYGHMPKSNVLAYAARSAVPDAKLGFVEHTTISRQYHGTKKLMVRALACSLYRMPDAVLTVSEGALASAISWGVPARKGHVVFNPIPVAQLQAAAQEPTRFWDGAAPLRLVTAGRLDAAKGFDVLLDALALLRAQGVAFTAVFLGDGPERQALISRAKRNGVADAVRFVGFQQNPAAVVAKADLFVCSSRHEGFSNVLAEALAVGVDCLSTDCPSGPSEILGGDSSRLVPPEDPVALAQGIQRWWNIIQLRNDSAKGAARAGNIRSAEAFDISKVARRYLEAVGLNENFSRDTKKP